MYPVATNTSAGNARFFGNAPALALWAFHEGAYIAAVPGTGLAQARHRPCTRPLTEATRRIDHLHV